MSVSIAPLFSPTLVSDTSSAVYIASGTVRVDKFTVSNPDTAAHPLTLLIVPSGYSSTLGTQITNARPIQPNETWDVAEIMGQVLQDGDAIWAMTDVTNQLILFGAGAFAA